MRGAKAMRVRRREEEQSYGPTPETLAKLKVDVVLRLHRQGRLTLEQLQAAEEIRRLWQAFGRGLFPTASGFGGGPRSAKGQPRHPIDHMTDSEERAFRRRYRPWAAEMGAASWRGKDQRASAGSPSRLALVYDLVIDNRGPRQIERTHRLRHGLAAQIVRLALHRYAEIAGWAKPGAGGQDPDGASADARAEAA